MKEEIRNIYICMVLLAMSIVCTMMAVVVASPLYINITDNQIMLLDVNWNGSAYQLNMTYYLQGYNFTTNFTAINYTYVYNVTNVNITCYNCSLNYTYNYFYNSSGGYNYSNWNYTEINQTDLDKISLSNENKITSVQTDLNTKITDLTSKLDADLADLKAFKDEKNNSFILLWITAGIAIVMAGVALFLIWGATRG